MVKSNKNKIIIASGIVLGVVTSALTGGLIGVNSVTPEDGITQVDVDAAYAQGFNDFQPKVITETVEVPVEVEKIINNTIEVEKLVEDESFKQMACDRLIYDDLKECVEEVKAEDAALKLALTYIDEDFSDIADELEESNLVRDENDVSLIKVYDSYEDIEVLRSNFDNEKYDFKVKVKVDDDDDKKSFYVTLRVEDGEVEIKSIEE